MKKIIFIISLFLCSFLFFGCKKSLTLVRLQELEEGVSNPLTESELKDAIKKYEKRVDDIIVAEGRIGIWYKILGTRYMDKKMYKKALESFQQALEYYPQNQNLFYKVGLSASLLAKNSLDLELTGSDVETKRYFALAVSAYTRAIEIDPKYSKAIYALSVLYIFELNKPLVAIPLLESVIERETKPLEFYFLLARAYYLINKSDEAISIYKKIIDLTASEEQKLEAEKNIQFILQEGDDS